MASRIPSREPTMASTAVACLVGTMAWILISSIYVGAEAGWPQFALSVFAAATVCTVGISGLVYAAHQQFVAKSNLFSDHDHDAAFDYRTTGQWAVVTGATDGIGKAYARQLAVDQGLDVLLVGRNSDKLRAVAELIRKESGGRRRVITAVADFAEQPVTRDGHCYATTGNGVVLLADQPNDEHAEDAADICFYENASHYRPSLPALRQGRCKAWYPRLQALIEGPLLAGGVGVLINCAGVCYPHPEYFTGMLGDGAVDGDDDADPASSPLTFTTEFCDNADVSIKCNVAAVTHMCRLVLPGMLARGRGLVINVGSASASMPPATPLMALYAATKKFVEKLSADLDAECIYLCRDKNAYGVRVQCVRPAYVATAMLRSANPDVRAATSDTVSGCWWTARKQKLSRDAERWLVPSADQWVRSALRQGGQLYASGSASGGPANYAGYVPHQIMIWTAQLASAVLPRGWYVENVLIPGMLTYRAKGRSAFAAAQKIKRGAGPQ